jgi:hypothetical protein
MRYITRNEKAKYFQKGKKGTKKPSDPKKLNERCRLVLDKWNEITDKANSRGMFVKYARTGSTIHVMVDDRRGKRILDWWPSNGTWYKESSGSKGKCWSESKLFDFIDGSVSYEPQRSLQHYSKPTPKKFEISEKRSTRLELKPDSGLKIVESSSKIGREVDNRRDLKDFEVEQNEQPEVLNVGSVEECPFICDSVDRMDVKALGSYELTDWWSSKGRSSISNHAPGWRFEITRVDGERKMCYSPDFEDWADWNMPAKRT